MCYDFTGSQISNSIHHYLVGNVDSRVLPTHFQRVRCCLVDISKELLAPHFDTIVDAKQESDIRSPYTPCKTVGERRSPVNQELTVPRSTEDSRPRYDETGTRTALMKQKTLQEMFCADAGHLKKTTVLHIDHMNDYKKYTKLLQKWAMQLDVQGCILFPEDARPRPRHVFVVMDAEHSSVHEFLRRLRTENVDVTIRGTPCKERQSNVVAEMETTPRENEHGPGLHILNLMATRNPLSHLPQGYDWLLQNRLHDGPAVVKHMRDYMNMLQEQKKASKRMRVD